MVVRVALDLGGVSEETSVAEAWRLVEAGQEPLDCGLCVGGDVGERAAGEAASWACHSHASYFDGRSDQSRWEFALEAEPLADLAFTVDEKSRADR